MNRLLTGINRAGLLPLAAAVVALLGGSAGHLHAGCCEGGNPGGHRRVYQRLQWHRPGTNSPGALSTTSGLHEEFGDAGGWARSLFANTLAWESDWKRTNLPGGADATFADAKDFGYRYAAMAMRASSDSPPTITISSWWPPTRASATWIWSG